MFEKAKVDKSILFRHVAKHKWCLIIDKFLELGKNCVHFRVLFIMCVISFILQNSRYRYSLHQVEINVLLIVELVQI